MLCSDGLIYFVLWWIENSVFTSFIMSFYSVFLVGLSDLNYTVKHHHNFLN